MGKKSKKKGKAGDNTKASRKERLQERREQQLDALDRDSDEDYDDDEASENEPPPPLQREYFVESYNASMRILWTSYLCNR
jgi:hypothetical protein